MVKENSHLLIAHEIAGKINSEEISRTIFLHQDEYYLGSVIPDAYFYNKKNDVISEKLHSANGELTSEIIFMLLDKARKNHKDNDLAFIFGYITHCAADITFHPMIHFMSGNYNSDSAALQDNARYRHHHIETYIDSMLNDSFYIDEVVHIKALRQLAFPEVLAGYMGMKPAQAAKITARCLKKQLLANRCFRSGAAYKLLHLLIKLKIIQRKNLLGLFYADLENNEKPFGSTIHYEDPVSGDKKQKSLAMLLDEAVNLGTGMVMAAYNYHSGKLSEEECRRIINGLSLETGMANTPMSMMKHFTDVDKGF